MPSATQPLPSMVSPPNRKRRRDEDAGVQMPFSKYEDSEGFLSSINHNQRLVLSANRNPASLLNVTRKIIPLPVSKKLRITDDNSHSHDQILKASNSPAFTTQQIQQQSYFPHAHPEQPAPATLSTSHQHIRPAMTRSNNCSLNPCHICHRKPIKKSDLDSFADCMGCAQRTCFVCIRACQGWTSPGPTLDDEQDLSASFTMRDVDDDDDADVRNDENGHIRNVTVTKGEGRQKKGDGGGTEDTSWSGRGHREVICSQCCVERGSEGDVVCLGCLASVQEV